MVSILIAAVIGIGSASGTVVGAAYTIVDKAQEMGYAPCANEDSVGPCYWDAAKRGNEKGTSFIVTDDNEVFK